ncbi:hypothetical protein MTE2_4983 [Klebsiella pneumoniae VA360]|nr:hypothetical protein MTE2_4983 [Klebsiella pneumoniae VA360]
MCSSFAISLSSSQIPRLRNMFSVLIKISGIVMAIVKVVMHLKWRTLNAYAFRIFLIINKCNKSNFGL